MNRAGFWWEDYHRGHCVSWGSGPPMKRDPSTGGVVLDVENFSAAVTPSFKFRSALVAVMCHHSSCWDLVALIRRLGVWRWITHSPLPALLQPHEAQTSVPVIPGSWSSPSHPDTVTPTRHWWHEIKQQCSRQIMNYAQHMHYGTQVCRSYNCHSHTISLLVVFQWWCKCLQEHIWRWLQQYFFRPTAIPDEQPTVKAF